MSVRLPDVPSNFPLKTGHIFVILALGMSLMSAILIKNLTTPKTPEAPKPVATVPVAVALNYVAPGSTITIDDIKLVNWPESYAPPGSTFNTEDSLLGRKVKAGLFPGQPIYKEQLAGEKSNGGLPILIPQGMRAITVAVTEIKGVAGFVKPGDHVDVLTTFEERSQTDDQLHVTKTVLQNVLVMASAQKMVAEDHSRMHAPTAMTVPEATPTTSTDATPAKPATAEEIEKAQKAKDEAKEQEEKEAKLVASVTLALTPEQTEKLALAEETGSIRLVLRPEEDSSIEPLSGITNHQLLTEGPSPSGGWPFKFIHQAPALPRTNVRGVRVSKTVEFINGADKKDLSF